MIAAIDFSCRSEVSHFFSRSKKQSIVVLTKKVGPTELSVCRRVLVPGVWRSGGDSAPGALPRTVRDFGGT